MQAQHGAAAALGAGVWTWLRDEPRPPIATAVSVPSSPAIQARELTQRAFALCRKLGFLRGDLAVPALAGNGISGKRLRFDRVESVGPDVVISGVFERV